VKVKNKKFLIKTKASALVHDIWRLVRLKPPKNVKPVEKMEVHTSLSPRMERVRVRGRGLLLFKLESLFGE